MLPAPGPFDEVALLVLACVLWLFYRTPLREAWGQTSVSDVRESAGPAVGDG